jgi:hypothetical protein
MRTCTVPTTSFVEYFGGHASLCPPYEAQTAADIAAGGRVYLIFKRQAYFGYLNSGAAFSASLVVFIDASHLSFLLS